MRAKLGIAAGMILVAVILVAFRPAPDGSSEIRRIQAHFDSVLVEMRARDASALTAEQLTRRSLLIETLVTYRNAGRFPRNYDFAEPTPYFVDRRTGILCAVAHLLESSGRRDIVDRVAAADNNVWVPRLAGASEFERWLDANGITLAEAARIQVPYVGDGPGTGATAQRRLSTLPIMSATAATLAGAANLMWNSNGHSRTGTVLGLVSGVTGAGVGLGMLADPQENRALTIASATAGVISTLIAARGVQRHRRAIAARRAEDARVAVAPLIPTPATGAGVSVNVRF